MLVVLPCHFAPSLMLPRNIRGTRGADRGVRGRAIDSSGPEDRAWCVATEIDFAWTYIGGGTDLIQGLINDPALEAMPTQIHHGITYEADRINPPPPAHP
jgi:hypothetical protein